MYCCRHNQTPVPNAVACNIVLVRARLVSPALNHWLGCGAYVVRALLWLIPARRIERAIAGN